MTTNTNTPAFPTRIDLHRDEPDYAWGECAAADGNRLCRNTVKFGAVGSIGCCPACGALYRAASGTLGDYAEQVSHADSGLAGKIRTDVHYYETYPGGKISGELVQETTIAADEHGIVVMTEAEYENSGSRAGRESRGADNYHEDYDVTTGNGIAVLHPRSIAFSDQRVQRYFEAR